MMTRRDFLGSMGWGAIVVSAGALVAALARFFDPPLTTPAPGPVEVGRPEDFAVGSLYYADKARAYVGRDERGLYAIAAICTHLGCTPRLAERGDTFVCPCHGSQFARDGQVTSGPAMRGLDRVFVGRGANGALLVDRSHTVDARFRLEV
ncbi:MAG TPA: ubiquinol-cytochrome c reductase iron-sulfur subunit [Anaerolineae bacterium]